MSELYHKRQNLAITYRNHLRGKRKELVNSKTLFRECCQVTNINWCMDSLQCKVEKRLCFFY